MEKQKLRQISQEELQEILEQHKLWLETRFTKEVKGKRANLRYANLRDADLRDTDLRDTDLRDADLSGADLSGANLRYANLSYANLRDANLSGANLDFSCFPLWCGGLDVHLDDKQAIQLLYHLVRNVQYSENTSAELKALLLQPQIIDKANQFHRVEECGKIELKEEGKDNEHSI